MSEDDQTPEVETGEDKPKRRGRPPKVPSGAPTQDEQIPGFPAVEGETIRVRVKIYKKTIEGFGRVLSGDYVDLPASIGKQMIADGEAEEC